ncbi:MAG TPA: hypothetical protein VJ717_11015 [Gemmatimonadaceae bacterium]|nr:hypothetical protein [Gemmatimonadaceae bacterium]
MRGLRLIPVIVALGALAPGIARAQAKKYEVRLKKAWVTKHQNRATVDARMTVRHTHKSANPVKKGGDDGDIHFSGESADIGLPFVAEVVNAGLAAQSAAKATIIAKQQSGAALDIAGAWRLWFEHPAKTQTQGNANPFEPDHTNPDHSFEIHPASRIDAHNIGGSFIPIAGYEAYAADVAFPFFDGDSITIKASSSAISIRSKKLKYNYVEFNIQLTKDPKAVQDGFIALAKVLDDTGDEEAADGLRRMIFVAGTPAAAAIQNAVAGDRFRVLGVPRLNLNAILHLVNKNGTKQFNAKLPYEMIIIGVL